MVPRLAHDHALFNRRLNLAQRFNYFSTILTYFDGWQKAVFYVAPAIVLVTGKLPNFTSAENILLHFLPYFLLTIWVFEETGRGFSSFVTKEQYNMARFIAFAHATRGWQAPIAATVIAGKSCRRYMYKPKYTLTPGTSRDTAPGVS